MSGSVITAGTTRTQAGATPITEDITTINTSTAPTAGTTLGDGVCLPQVGGGTDRVFLINNTANAVQVYGFNNGSTYDTINGVVGSTGVILPPNSASVFVEAVPGAWSQVATGEGYSGSFATQTAVSGVAAHSGGGQANATPLTAAISRVTTVAAAGDSVLLPPAVPGLELTVVNATATNAMSVYPSGSDVINAAATSFSVVAAKTATFYCTNAGQWHSLLSA